MTDDPVTNAAARRSLIALLESDLLFGIEEIPAGAPAATAAAARESPPDAGRIAPQTTREGARPLVPPLAALLGGPDQRARLDQLAAEVSACTRCRLHERRRRAVPGEGNAGADLMFVGEGPGADEDATGRPFVGAAGELLTKILEATGFTRETVFIANVVKCRPPGNRTPEPDEAAACLPFLRRQIEIIAPKAICALGSPATKALLGTDRGVSALRGTVQAIEARGDAGGIPVVPTFHPAYLLRRPEDKGKVWRDMQLVARVVVERGGAVPRPDVLERNSRGANAPGGR